MIDNLREHEEIYKDDLLDILNSTTQDAATIFTADEIEFMETISILEDNDEEDSELEEYEIEKLQTMWKKYCSREIE